MKYSLNLMITFAGIYISMQYYCVGNGEMYVFSYTFKAIA